MTRRTRTRVAMRRGSTCTESAGGTLLKALPSLKCSSRLPAPFLVFSNFRVRDVGFHS